MRLLVLKYPGFSVISQTPLIRYVSLATVDIIFGDNWTDKGVPLLGAALQERKSEKRSEWCSQNLAGADA